ncbi:MAG TPA: class I tRNA ligase family protein [Chitinophagales bacterium]|nr:class I tRNA ligase family protein [Chitinophagales bacterium]HRH54806.1 class I tRNA ligase family protein [Chitinophagales bacterium]
MDYSIDLIQNIERKWNQKWKDSNLYKVTEDPKLPKYYVLDMFPYPSGSGLHVGHPLGYVASDIISRFKRLQGFNVLHPMGFDAFGLPAEQYAIETGQHPAITTEKNINYFREQLSRMGFCYDWSREVKTCDPNYYKWTQWIFTQLFKSWYNPFTNKSEKIDSLIAILNEEGTTRLFALDKCQVLIDATTWKNYDVAAREKLLMQFRLAYLDYADIWWCEMLGTVLANDEVKDGVSERGGHPVEKIKMRQWFLRITEFADRLLEGLNRVDFSESMKEMQRNWIGKSEGALVKFNVAGANEVIEIFTTRPDTIFGATFMVLAPEHELVEKITTAENRIAIEEYIKYVKSRSERDRMSEVKKVTGEFTGAYALNPFNGKSIPIYIAEYVLAGYGTGAIMAVPSNDDRDFAFAQKFDLPVIPVVDQSAYPQVSREDKIGVMINSDMLTGLEVKDAIQKMLSAIEEKGIGKRRVNYRLRDAGFSRQRYWGEPFPVYYENDVPHLLEDNELPLLLPQVESYKPAGAAKSPLSGITEWVNFAPGKMRETDTMPGYAGSSWYFYRYMDVHNDQFFASREKIDYWQDVDLYIGGTEHAVGHLLYSRMWNKFLFDIGLVAKDEPFKRLVNQGMIQGVSKFIYRLLLTISAGEKHKHYYDSDLSLMPSIFVSKNLGIDILNQNEDSEIYKSILIMANQILTITYMHTDAVITQLRVTEVRVASNCFVGENLNIKNLIYFKSSDEKVPFTEFYNAHYILEDFTDYQGSFGILEEMQTINFIASSSITEKMSKSKYNVVNPDDVINEYGADCFRMYEMFLGPIDAGKPWDTKGITGVQGFLRKLWRLFIDEQGQLRITNEAPTTAELKLLHKTIKKAGEDIEKLSFNTAVSAFMICVNELQSAKCYKREILEQLLILVAPFAPFITEELWEKCGHTDAVHIQSWPKYDATYLTESNFNYPVSINGKVRANIELPLDMEENEIRETVLGLESVVKWTEGNTPKKVIIVKGRIVNVVL